MKKTLFLFLLSLFLIISLNNCDKLGSDDVIKFTLLQTSDMHSHAGGFGASSDYTPEDNSDNDSVFGGFTRIASLIAKVRKDQEKEDIPVVVVDSGDYFMGTVYDMAVSDPISLKFFQMVGYDAITLGNHEFDWSAQGLAMLLANGLSNGFTVPIVASNMVTSDSSAGDDGLESLVGMGRIVNKKVMELSNGLKIGILGIMGVEADSLAPLAAPVTFNHDYSFLQSRVNDLRNNDKVDVVIVLSHGGIHNDGTGDDKDIADNVTGIDIIASGHYHTATSVPFTSGASGTLIFSPGEYGKYLSRLDISFNMGTGKIESSDFELMLVDDKVKNRTIFETVVSQYKNAIDQALSAAELSLDKPVSKTSWAIEMQGGTESGLGNMAADALRAVAGQLAPLNDGAPYHVGVIPNGVIRDGLFPGKTGIVTFTDIFNTIPLGISPDTTQLLPGYPLISIYVTGPDLRNACEAGITVSSMLGSDFYLNFSGLKMDYNPSLAPYLQGVTAVYLSPLDDYFTMQKGTAINLSDTTSLYHVVVDLYALQMMNAVTSLGLTIIPRDSSGGPISPQEFMLHRIDSNAGPGMQELKEWGALMSFLGSFFPASGNGIPQTLYGPGGAAMGRVSYVQ
ncbi:MAG: metallophosphoesterase [Acidobacteriota bacterium]